MRRSLISSTLLLSTIALTLLVGRAEASSQAPRLAVLYFDNNTADKKLNVLQKGLADMFITDLASVRGIVVVERDKLQSILKELKLQRSRFFNKRTAVRIGKQLGATHVVSGNFAIAGDKIRIGARLIRVRTGRVVIGKKVVGAKTAIFELEQKLVALFVDGLRQATGAGSAATPARPIRAYRPRRRGRTHVPNVATLVDYSKGLDLIDRGKLRAAALRLAAVSAQAPRFGLAKQRQRELKRRLKQAGKRRAMALSDQAKALRTRARAYVKRHKLDKKTPKDVAKNLLGYRVAIGRLQLRAMRKHLTISRPNLVLPGKRRDLLVALDRYVKNQLALLKAIARYAKLHTRVFNGIPVLDRSVGLPPVDQRAMQESELGSIRLDPAVIGIELGQLLLAGRHIGPSRKLGSLAIAPPPSMLSPRYRKIATQLLGKVVKEQDKQAKRKVPMAEYHAIRARIAWGNALLILGKREAAVAKWQEVLDKYPTSQAYKSAERLIKEQLGLKRTHTSRTLKRYRKGLKSCKDMDLRVGLRTILSKRIRLLGLAGIQTTIKEIEKACRAKHNSGQARLKHFWRYLYQSAALRVGKFRLCKRFDTLIKRAVQEGLSPRSAGLYRKNYTSCP